MYKTPQLRNTFRSYAVEKVHAVVARSTFLSQNAENASCSDPFWKLRCRKSARRWAWSTFRNRNVKNTIYSDHFWKLCTCRISKNDGRRGTFEEDLQRCIFRSRRNTRDMFIRDVRRSGRWFPERGCILEHQIFNFGKMILRDRCSTSHDLASLFRGRRSCLDKWSGKIAKGIGTRPSALHSTFHVWRTSRSIVSFLMLSTSKIEEVSQNCFVFAVVKFTNWGSLAELSRFWYCQVQKFRKPRRIASFSSLQIDS